MASALTSKRMANMTLVDQLILAIAACRDQQRRLTSLNVIGSIAGDPRLTKYQRLAHQYLRHRRERIKIQKAWHYLKRRGYLQERVLGSSTAYLLTPKGEHRRLHLEMRTDHRKSGLPRGTWLMVLFDIPESLRKRRDALRVELRVLGFEQLQKSVWVTSRDVRRELTKIIEILNLPSYVKLLIVKELPV